MLVHGIIAVIGSIVNRKEADDWWLVLLEGIVGIIIGIMTFAWPALTGLVLAYFIAGWALIMGILRVYEAIKLAGIDKHLPGYESCLKDLQTAIKQAKELE